MRKLAHAQLEVARENVKAWETALLELDPIVEAHHAELKQEGAQEGERRGGAPCWRALRSGGVRDACRDVTDHCALGHM